MLRQTLNNNISSLSALCASVQVKKVTSQMKPYFSDWFELRGCDKQWASALLSVKCCCFGQNYCKSVDLAHLKKNKKEERRTVWLFGDVLVWYFRDDFCATSCAVGYANTRRRMVCFIKAYKFAFFEIFMYYHILHVCPTLHLEPTDSRGKTFSTPCGASSGSPQLYMYYGKKMSVGWTVWC